MSGEASSTHDGAQHTGRKNAWAASPPVPPIIPGRSGRTIRCLDGFLFSRACREAIRHRGARSRFAHRYRKDVARMRPTRRMPQERPRRIDLPGLRTPASGQIRGQPGGPWGSAGSHRTTPRAGAAPSVSRKWRTKSLHSGAVQRHSTPSGLAVGRNRLVVWQPSTHSWPTVEALAASGLSSSSSTTAAAPSVIQQANYFPSFAVSTYVAVTEVWAEFTAPGRKKFANAHSSSEIAGSPLIARSVRKWS